MLKVQVVGLDEIIAKYKIMPAGVHKELTKTVTSLTAELLNLVKRKLSGQVLNVKTGALHSGVFSRIKDTPTEIVGSVVAPKTVPYAAIHEFGGTIEHPGGTPYLIDSKTGLATFISKSSALAQYLPVTKPHTIKMPERSYLRSSLKDMQQKIIAQLKKAFKEGADGHGG